MYFCFLDDARSYGTLRSRKRKRFASSESILPSSAWFLGRFTATEL